MLVFTRKRNEAVMIGDGVEVRILRIGRDGVRVGIEAARSVAVHRREVYDTLSSENRSAATPAMVPTELTDGLRHLAARRGLRAEPLLTALSLPLAVAS